MRWSFLFLVCFSCARTLVPAAPTYMLGAAPGVEEALVADEVFAPADPEPRPEKLGTPQSSKKSRPSWADPDYAPQYRYELPSPVIEADQIDEALLVCDVDASKVPSQDFFGGKNEIGLSLQIGKTTIRGDFKSSSASAPLVSIKNGESFKLRVYDLDYLSDKDPIEFLTIKYKGKWPISADGKRVSYRCYIAQREEVESQLTDRLGELDNELDKLDAAPTPNLYASWIPQPDGFAELAKQKTAPLAALVGWDDPSVVSRVEKIAALEKKHSDDLKANTKEAFNTASSLGTALEDENNFSLTPSLVCDKKNLATYKKFDTFGDASTYLRKTTCVVSLHVENTGVEPIKSGYFDAGPLSSVSALNANGEEIHATFVAIKTDDGLIAHDKLEQLNVGQAVDFIFIVESSQLNTKKPTDKTPYLLRLVLKEQQENPVWYVRLRDAL